MCQRRVKHWLNQQRDRAGANADRKEAASLERSSVVGCVYKPWVKPPAWKERNGGGGGRGRGGGGGEAERLGRNQTMKTVFFLSQLSFECMKNRCNVWLTQDNHRFYFFKVLKQVLKKIKALYIGSLCMEVGQNTSKHQKRRFVHELPRFQHGEQPSLQPAPALALSLQLDGFYCHFVPAAEGSIFLL